MNTQIPQNILDQMNKISGRNVTASAVNSGVTSRSQEVSDLINKSSSTVASTSSSSNPISAVTDVVKRGGEDYAKNIGQDVQNMKSDITDTTQNPIVRGFKLAGHAVDTVFQPVTSLVNGVVSKISDNPELQKLAQTKGVSAVLDAVSGAQGAYSDWAKAHPNESGILEGTLKSAMGALGTEGDTNVPSPREVGSDLKAGATDVIKGIDTATQKGVNMVNEGLSNVGEKISGVKSAASSKAINAIEGRSQAEIMATPESEVYKLPKNERDVYFSGKKAEIDANAKANEDTIRTAVKKNIQAGKDNINSLNKELASASRDETLAARPKIRAMMSQQSSIYRNLVDKELAPYKDLPISHQELHDFVSSRYAEDPQYADAVAKELGIKKPDGTTPDTSTTIGKIYDQAKGLRQDVGSAVKNGTRVYTPAEKTTEDAIATLSDFLKSKGVDLKEANKFWAEYAPIRNQIVREAKPFLQTPTQTKTFANTLSRVAKGTDVNNENFISELEKRLGEPLAQKQKSIFSKIDQQEKDLFAQKIEADQKIIDNRLAKEQATKKLDAKQFEIERQAKLRDYMKSAIKWFIGLTAAGEAVKHLPLP